MVVMALGTDGSVSPGAIRRALEVLGPTRVLGLVTPRESGGGSTSGTCSSSALNTVTICAPLSGASSGSPVYVSAAASSQYTVTAMQIYVDYSLAYKVSGSAISTNLALGSGAHRLDIKAWTTAGTSFMSTTKVTVP